MNTAVKQPLKWHGGKSYLASWIIERMPEHTHYIETHGGGLAVLLHKDPEGVAEIVNDRDFELINFWTVLRDDSSFARFKRSVDCIPLSETEFHQSSINLILGNDDQIERAVAFFVRCRMSRQGLRKDYTTPTRRLRRGMNEQVSAWLTAVDGLPEVHERLRRVEIRCMDALDLIERYDQPNALFYLDPPYMHETRSTKTEYRSFEMSYEDHESLLDCLSTIEGKFMLSGYTSDLYESWAAKHGFGVHRFEIDNKASSAKTKEKKVECVWHNSNFN